MLTDSIYKVIHYIVGKVLFYFYLTDLSCFVLSTGQLFIHSCIPGAMDKDYNPNQKPVSLCEGCAAGGFRKCQRTSEDQYFSSSGAFRCLTESESRGSIIVHSLIFNYGGLIFLLDFMGTTHWHPDIELWNTIFILSLYHGSTMLYPYKSVKKLERPPSLQKKMCSHKLKWLQSINYKTKLIFSVFTEQKVNFSSSLL